MNYQSNLYLPIFLSALSFNAGATLPGSATDHMRCTGNAEHTSGRHTSESRTEIDLKIDRKSNTMSIEVEQGIFGGLYRITLGETPPTRNEQESFSITKDKVTAEYSNSKDNTLFRFTFIPATRKLIIQSSYFFARTYSESMFKADCRWYVFSDKSKTWVLVEKK